MGKVELRFKDFILPVHLEDEPSNVAGQIVSDIIDNIRREDYEQFYETVFADTRISDETKESIACFEFKLNASYKWGMGNFNSELLSLLVRHRGVLDEGVELLKKNPNLNKDVINVILETSIDVTSDHEALFSLLTFVPDEMLPEASIRNMYRKASNIQPISYLAERSKIRNITKSFIIRVMRTRLDLHDVPDEWIEEMLSESE